MRKKIIIIVVGLAALLIIVIQQKQKTENIALTVVDRESKIPLSAQKITPAEDNHPPILHSQQFDTPEPLQVINTAGAEDSPFIPNDRNEIYFFFTPDPNIPAEKQLFDGVTGIYVSQKVDGKWQKAERVILQDKNKLSLDGCEYIHSDTMWFCTTREGYNGLHWFRAEYRDGRWANWQIADFNPEYKVGELHFSNNGELVYFHSDRAGGKGQNDIWMMKKENGKWQTPQNIAVVNTSDNEGWPYLTSDEKELWFTRFYRGTPSVWRSKNINDKWQAPELVVSQFAGEPTLDNEGNLYFVHHFYKDGQMVEADIYIANKKD